jgi:hypothetical protein
LGAAVIHSDGVSIVQLTLQGLFSGVLRPRCPCPKASRRYRQPG